MVFAIEGDGLVHRQRNFLRRAVRSVSRNGVENEAIELTRAAVAGLVEAQPVIDQTDR